MLQSIKNISKNKYNLMSSIINSTKDDKFFKYLDTLLVKKRFDDAYELSLSENLLHVNTYNLTSTNINKIVKDFICSTQKTDFFDKRSLYEIVKLSTLSADKLKQSINKALYEELATALMDVSCETKFISFDFLILKIADNFMLKTNYDNIKELYQTIKNEIIHNLIYKNYNEEKKEKETTVLCWIDRILTAIINKEISPDDFVLLINKIFTLTHQSIYPSWKALHAVGYLLLQPGFCTSQALRKFKRDIIKSIDEQYHYADYTADEVTNLVVQTLAKRFFCKEDYYYLFDVIKITAQKSIEDKIHCLRLCKYIVNHNSKQNIFCFRFIRKYFIEMFFSITNKQKENIKIKEEELSILIALFHVDTYFCFNRHEIFKRIVKILKTINNGKTKLNYINFYRFCDVLDYIMSENPDVKDNKIMTKLSYTSDDTIKLKEYFDLSFLTV